MKRLIVIVLAAAFAVACTAGDIEQTLQEYESRIHELESEVEQLTITISDGSIFPVCQCSGHPEVAGHLVSIQEFGVLPSNTPEANRKALQKAIDVATKEGLAP